MSYNSGSNRARSFKSASRFAFVQFWNCPITITNQHVKTLWFREIRPHCGSCSVAMEITKEGAQSLRMKMRNAKLYLKEALVVYGFHPLEARLPELASKLEKLHCTHLFNSENRSKLSINWLLVAWAMIRNCCGSILWDDRSRRYKAAERYHTRGGEW